MWHKDFSKQYKYNYYHQSNLDYKYMIHQLYNVENLYILYNRLQFLNIQCKDQDKVCNVHHSLYNHGCIHMYQMHQEFNQNLCMINNGLQFQNNYHMVMYILNSQEVNQLILKNIMMDIRMYLDQQYSQYMLMRNQYNNLDLFSIQYMDEYKVNIIMQNPYNIHHYIYMYDQRLFNLNQHMMYIYQPYLYSYNKVRHINCKYFQKCNSYQHKKCKKQVNYNLNMDLYNFDKKRRNPYNTQLNIDGSLHDVHTEAEVQQIQGNQQGRQTVFQQKPSLQIHQLLDKCLFKPVMQELQLVAVVEQVSHGFEQFQHVLGVPFYSYQLFQHEHIPEFNVQVTAQVQQFIIDVQQVAHG
ncbi:unnamed protein product [Paramecium sonneborni]|uniref:Uncharacterized protein n=1 Tax=Paramecium sonneborni TaxID=65129 RepID=A0A8S1PZG9_9CILI|nr:unnamed protein product [Paramecium sonneborni]